MRSAPISAGPAAVVQAAGFRPRKLVLNPGTDEQDYQAAFAYQGAIAYVYLADRSTCPNPGMTCDWKRPPRYKRTCCRSRARFTTRTNTADR